MKLCSLASGSSGNCIFMGSEHTSVLIDAGISGKRVEAGLNDMGYSCRDLDGVFLTHEHMDHVKGVGVLARKYGLPIFATRGTWEAVRRMKACGAIPEELYREVRPDQATTVGDITVSPFHISHDAADPVGYRVSAGGRSAAVATDMGRYDDYTVQQLQQLDALVLEANHDVHMLEVGRYPYYLKMRILGDRGHLSNETSGQLLSAILHDRLRHILLGHLSEENNYPALAYETVCQEVTMGDNPYRASDFDIAVARRDQAGPLLEF